MKKFVFSALLGVIVTATPVVAKQPPPGLVPSIQEKAAAALVEAKLQTCVAKVRHLQQVLSADRTGYHHMGPFVTDEELRLHCMIVVANK